MQNALNNCWQILNIEPTQDVGVIKRAYALLLKQNRPDQEPEKFRTLHQAYQEAQWLARFEQANASVLYDSPQPSQVFEAKTDDDLKRIIENLMQQPARSSAELQTDHTASTHQKGLIDDWLIPTDWLRQLNTLLHQTPTQPNAWQAWFADAKHFKDEPEIRNHAQSILLNHLETLYFECYRQIEQTPYWHHFAAYCEQRNGFTETLFKEWAQLFGWWKKPYQYDWHASYDLRLMSLIVDHFAPLHYQREFNHRYMVLRYKASPGIYQVKTMPISDEDRVSMERTNRVMYALIYIPLGVFFLFMLAKAIFN